MKNLEKTKVFNVNIDKVDELATPRSIGEEILSLMRSLNLYLKAEKK